MANISCGDKILDYLVVPALKKLLHPVFCFQSIIDDFKEQNRGLSLIQEKVENDMQRDRDNARVIYENVETWLKEVIALMPEVRHVESELEKNKRCCFRYSWCPNWTCHYKFSKQVSEITTTMKTLCATGESFNNSVSHPPTLHQDITASSSSVGFMHSQSSKSAFNQIMEALERDDVNLIGLHGVVGTGKTALAEQVFLEAKAIFCHVILVRLSEKQDVRSIQGLLAGFLGLSLDRLESDQVRASKLRMRLQSGDKILIILDDVRRDSNIGVVGIPTVGCKLLLTAPTLLEVPDSMRTQRDVKLGTLLEDEAWTLFESVAGVGEEVRMHGPAKAALAECRGIPKAVVEIGTALKGKRVPEWTETLQQLKKDKFKLLQSEEFMFSKAAKSACDQIMKAMETDGANMIGMYGMGGIGKTTLARQVHDEAVTRSIFDRAVMVTVSQKPDVGNMQNMIAKALGFNWPADTESLDERASKLKQRLRDEKILIILDDVWKCFELESTGIMLNDCKACKVLLTTRQRDVCTSMDCQEKIQLNLLSEEESQIFFKTKAGLPRDFMLDHVGKQIVEECKCLPIALQTVGAALKNKGKDEWTEALGKLRNAKLVDIMGVHKDDKNAYKCVKLSYDYLKESAQTQQAQFILLICSIFPEDYKIELEKLARYAFGMELFEDVRSIEDVRIAVRVIIRFLKDSCLLIGIGDEEYFTMHDVVRDTMLWIGSTEPQERKVLTVRDNRHMKELIKKKSFQNCRAVSFMSGVIPKLNKYSKLECPNLETVLIFTNGEDVELGEGFFENIQLLKVLDIKGAERWTKCKFAMPQSLHCLKYLRTLMLRDFKCSNSCILRELRSLRILSLRGCKIDGGVEVMSGLRKLRLLDLVELGAETRIFSFNVIEGFNKLEELYGYKVGSSSNLSKLTLLSNLVALHVHIEDGRCLPTSFCFQDLTNYYICVGVMYKPWLSIRRQSRRLELSGIKDESVWTSTCNKLLPTVQYLSLEECNIMEWVFEFQLQFLRILSLSNLPQLKHIWKGPTRLVSLCNLTQVEISNCKKLISIFSSPSLATSMHQLEVLKIEWCPNLEEIISIKGGSDDDDDFSCCCCFTNLRELQVVRCKKVKTIFPIVKSTGRAPHLHPQSSCLPKLQQITLRSNKEMKHIFGYQTEGVGVECPSLQVLEVIDCPNISTTHFVATTLQEAPSPQPLTADSTDNIQGLEQRQHNDLSQYTIVCSSTLKRVRLRQCHKLKQVFTTTLVTSLCQLEELIVEECDELEQVISKDEDGKEEPTTVCFKNLDTLKGNKCRKLKTIFPITIALPKLETLELRSNDEMEHIFGQSDGDYTMSYPFSKNLCVEGCPKMCTQFTAAFIQKMLMAKVQEIALGDIKGVREIMQIERQKDNDIDEFFTCQLRALKLKNIVDLECICRGPTQNICFEKLYRLEVIGCNKLKHLLETTALPQLEYLIVERCNELEQVIVMTENGKEKNGDANGVGFRELMYLEVSECEKLKTIFTISIALPKLRGIELKSNEELERVFGQSDWDCIPQFPVLEKLCVVGCPKVCIQCVQNLSTAKKEIETIRGNNLLTFPLRFLSLWNVEELTCIWAGPTLNIWFRLLYEVKVIGCNRLKHIFITPISTSLPWLGKLIVQRCNELEQVMMVGDGKEEREVDENAELIVEVGFQNLEVLYVSDCEKLKTIFSISVPLPDLKYLRVEGNAELESIFGESDCDYTAHWTGLKQLSITGCPKLCTHSIAIIKCQLQATAKNSEIINLSNIQGVEEIVRFQRQDDGDGDGDGDSDDDGILYREFESRIRRKARLVNLGDYEDHYRILYRKFQLLKLEEVRDLERIWSGPTENISFSFLVAIRVIGCNRLKQLFTTTMATTLHRLEVLAVERCHELEHVIQEEEDGNEKNNLQSLQQLELPNLRLLRLLDSPNLVSFCPSSCNLVLPLLTEMGLQVEGCPKLVTDICSQKSDKQDDEDEEEENDDSDDKCRYSSRSIKALFGASFYLGRRSRQVRLAAERSGSENE